jgi:RNA polymerase sigma-70 factor (ECF subfamily)
VSADRVDFAEFFERRRAGCQRAVYAVVGDQRQAEELVAEAFARAWARWESVSRHPAPQAWIVRTALNGHISGWRRRRREIGWDGQQEPIAVPSSGSQLDREVIDALRALPRRQREVVVLRTFLDLDTQATADALGIATGTVRAHLHRALQTLRLSLHLDQEVKP